MGKVFDGKRCCKNCTIIFGIDGNFGPFVLGELEPVDDGAKQIITEILAFNKSEIEREKQPPRQIIYTRSFQKAKAKLTGEIYFDAPTFEIKKGST